MTRWALRVLPVVLPLVATEDHATVGAELRRAILNQPDANEPKLRLAQHVLGHVAGWGHESILSEETFAEYDEMARLMREVLSSPGCKSEGSPAVQLCATATQLLGRALRVHKSKGKEAAAFLEAEVGRATSATRRAELMIELGHLHMQYRQLRSSMKYYQDAHGVAPSTSANAELRDIAKQGGAMAMAVHSRCMGPASAQSIVACQGALKIFLEVPDEHTQAASWMMRGYILRYHQSPVDVLGAVEAGQRAVKQVPHIAEWWQKLSHWARAAHTFTGQRGFDSEYMRTSFSALQRAHRLEASIPGSWQARLDAELRAESEATFEAAEGMGAEDGSSEGSCHAEPGGESAFPVISAPEAPDAACEEIDASDVTRIVSQMRARAPFLVRNGSEAAYDTRWSTAHLAASPTISQAMVEVSFSNEKGELNTFEPLSEWLDFFQNQTKSTLAAELKEVLVRPIRKVLTVRQLLELLHRRKDSAAGVRGLPCLHQTEMHMNLVPARKPQPRPLRVNLPFPCCTCDASRTSHPVSFTFAVLPKSRSCCL
jgi:hypothetical protein